jgi:hypothetical protein
MVGGWPRRLRRNQDQTCSVGTAACCRIRRTSRRRMCGPEGGELLAMRRTCPSHVCDLASHIPAIRRFQDCLRVGSALAGSNRARPGRVDADPAQQFTVRGHRHDHAAPAMQIDTRVLTTVAVSVCCVSVLSLAAGGAVETAPAGGAFSTPPGVAVAYDPALVPVGPRGTISARVAGTITTVTLEVSGLQPNRQYGAYAHTKRAARRGRTPARTSSSRRTRSRRASTRPTPTRRTRSGSI